jgi:hypothetical protein
MKKKMIALLAGALMMISASSAFAAFSDLELIRVVYQRTGGTVEAATDLGNVNTLLASGGNVGGGVNAFTTITGTAFATSDLYVAYFAVDITGKKMWMSGTGAEGIGTLKTSLITGVANTLYTQYNSPAPVAPATSTVGRSTGDAASYFKKADLSTSFGSFGNAITIGAGNVEASLATLASGSVSQNLYYFANFGGTLAERTGVLSAQNGTTITILTNADGSTTVNATPIPAAIYLMGSGLLGMVGLRRKKRG